MKHLLSILLICSIGFTQELTVDGNLNVTGNIQNQTIDSLQQVIAGLQAQIAALQVTPSLGGVAEYTSNSTWTVPDGVDRVYAEIWGGSGSGGGSAQYFNTCAGGGGGSGGYVRVIFPVIAGEIIEINISDENNYTGFRRESGNYITYSTAGLNGSYASGSSNSSGGSGGTGFINEGVGIIRNGSGGGGGSCNGCPGASPGSGGQPIQGSIQSLASSGGSGGPCGSANGGNGGGGYIYMVW